MRWHNRISIVLLVSTFAVALGCGGDSGQQESAGKADPAKQPSSRDVTINEFRYDPPTLTVAVGTRVTWLNRDDVPHTVTSTATPPAFKSATLDTDDTFAHTFTTPGTFEYFCAVHPKMTARVIVK